MLNRRCWMFYPMVKYSHVVVRRLADTKDRQPHVDPRRIVIESLSLTEDEAFDVSACLQRLFDDLGTLLHETRND